MLTKSKMASIRKLILLYSIIISLAFGCQKDKKVTDPLTDVNNTYGFGLLQKIKGIWNGPVTSTTAIGSFPEWIVDFRPIAENQVSSKNELDKLNDIFMSFFVAKYNNQYRLAFRNGGSFSGRRRVSYFLCDSVAENTTQSYFRFSEIIIGKNRAYTEVIFSADSVYINSFTNIYSSQSAPSPHMNWKAKLQDLTSCADAVTQFGYPKKSMAQDFSYTFIGAYESAYYSMSGDPGGEPYPEIAHPYLGKVTLNYSYASGFVPNASKKVLLVITTQPLINGFSINTGNLKTRSRYVVLAANDNSFTFNYMHPGSYYCYALYDNDGNKTFSSGDWVSSINFGFSLANKGNVSASTQINFIIP